MLPPTETTIKRSKTTFFPGVIYITETELTKLFTVVDYGFNFFFFNNEEYQNIHIIENLLRGTAEIKI